MFNVASVKKILGAKFEVTARRNGQISVGIARDLLASTTDAAKFEVMKDAYAKLKGANFPVNEFEEVFKASNPPIPGSESTVWRSYFHLLLTPPEAGATTVVDPGPEYLKTMLGAGVPLAEALEALAKLKGGTVPTTTTTEAGVVDADADPEVPV